MSKIWLSFLLLIPTILWKVFSTDYATVVSSRKLSWNKIKRKLNKISLNFNFFAILPDLQFNWGLIVLKVQLFMSKLSILQWLNKKKSNKESVKWKRPIFLRWQLCHCIRNSTMYSKEKGNKLFIWVQNRSKWQKTCCKFLKFYQSSKALGLTIQLSKINTCLTV